MSEFDLRIHPQSLVFHRQAGSPATIEMRRGRLIVDGRDIALDVEDARKIQRFETEIRAIVPEVKAIAMDAVGIASEAVIKVSRSFGAATRRRRWTASKRSLCQTTARSTCSKPAAEKDEGRSLRAAFVHRSE